MRLMSMIVSPNILTKKKGQAFTAYSALLGQLPFEVPPEPFEPIDMAASPVGVFATAVIHQPMHIPFRGQPGVAAPAVGAHHGSLPDPLCDTGLEIPGFDPRHNFGPHLPVAAENAEDGLLRGPSASLRAPASRGFPLVFPLSSDIRLVDFHNPTERGWEVRDHGTSECRKEGEEFVLADRAPFKHDIGRVFEIKFGDHLSKERSGNDHTPHAGPEGGATARTPHFSTPEFPESFMTTSLAPEHRLRS
jgi:hypothetical protein